MPDKEYEKKTISIESIIINPDNARFYEQDTDLLDDILGMNNIIDLDSVYAINLAQSIAQYGILPNQMPIVSPIEKKPGYYLAYDGNRRLTSLKLITMHKSNLDKFHLSKSQKEILSQLSSNITTIECIVSDNADFLNRTLLTIHAETTPGLHQVNWVPQAKAKHLRKTTGSLSLDLAIADLLESLASNDAEILKIIHKGKWVSKMKRFTRNKSTLLLLGFEEAENSKIRCYFDHATSAKIFIQFFKALNAAPASNIAQKAADRDVFLADFLMKNSIQTLPLNNMEYLYDPYIKKFNFSKTRIDKTHFEENLNKFMKKMFPDSTTPTDQQDTPPNQAEVSPTGTENPEAHPKSSTEKTVINNTDSNTTSPALKPIPNTSKKAPVKNKKKKKFFAALTYTKIDPETELPLFKICQEISNFSKVTAPAYKEYPIAATVLFRSLVEQCLKRLLRKTMPDAFNRLKNRYGGSDPALGSLQSLINTHRDKLFPDILLQRRYSALFSIDGFKDGLDLAVHHSISDTDFLEEKSESFFPIADYILNTDLQKVES